MSLNTALPNNYGYVILGVLGGHFVANMALSFKVMSARKQFKIGYPNLYAVPGYHKDADAFNRVQRGHQNMLETLGLFLAECLIGGLAYPITAGALGAAHSLGCILYQVGYADTAKDVKTARFSKGGMLKPLSEMGAVIMLGKMVYELMNDAGASS